MRNKISAIIIDPLFKTRDYCITTPQYAYNAEIGIDIKTLDSTENLYSELNQFKGYDAIITVGADIDFYPLSTSSFEIRKKWVHFDDYNKDKIANAIVATFLLNINRDKGEDKLFSIFTCTFNTPKKDIIALYESLKKQTYVNWNWWILDDSNINGSAADYLSKLKDPRIIVIKNITNHGNIGFNKHLIASACDGDYLVEIDHDDEITSDCLEYLKKAFDTFPDADFVYSHAMEEMDGMPVLYTEDEYALGQGKHEKFMIEGQEYLISTTPDVNCLTVRHIVGLPNHVRCWKKDFYHRIGGHNTELSVLDDMDLLIRTFLYGKMCKVPKVLYIQHEGSSSDSNGRGSTTQGKRLPEIIRLGALLRSKYDLDIHNRIMELGYEDKIWNNEGGFSEVCLNRSKFEKFNYVLEI